LEIGMIVGRVSQPVYCISRTDFPIRQICRTGWETDST
jgi:hypothetical protein